MTKHYWHTGYANWQGVQFWHRYLENSKGGRRQQIIHQRKAMEAELKSRKQGLYTVKFCTKLMYFYHDLYNLDSWSFTNFHASLFINNTGVRSQWHVSDSTSYGRVQLLQQALHGLAECQLSCTGRLMCAFTTLMVSILWINVTTLSSFPTQDIKLFTGWYCIKLALVVVREAEQMRKVCWTCS